MLEKLKCDLVMKGGITSGVVYPRLIAELAKTHTFKSIGGTSAGAIAAAGAAAAQYGANRGVTVDQLDPFVKLGQLPEELGETVNSHGDSKLLAFFAPQKQTRKVFNVLIQAISKKTPILGVVKQLLMNHYFVAMVAAIPFLVTLYTAYISPQVWQQFWIALVGVFLLIIPVVAAILCTIRNLITALPKQDFGLATGMPPVGEDLKASQALPQTLTPWLYDYFNHLSGKSSEKPLTFGDLWGTDDKGYRPSKPDIDFQAVTTCLNLTKPLTMPFEEGVYFYSDSEWRKLFPSPMMDWLNTHARESSTVQAWRAHGNSDLFAFPLPKDWPVVIAVRMSLSFPILLSAIPIYRVDFTLAKNARQSGVHTVTPTKMYCTDGGVSSNFPLHLFDSPFPRHPTFAINLKPYHPDIKPDQYDAQRVFLADDNSDGLIAYIPTIPQTNVKGLIWFASSIINTMQNWRDQLPVGMPGYRDRIAHISHTDQEGGLNLNMAPEVIRSLGHAGGMAAIKLQKQFYEKQANYKNQTGWDNHRWIRMRTSLALMDKQLADLDSALSQEYIDLTSAPPPSYPFDSRLNGAHQVSNKKAKETMNRIKLLAQELKNINGDLQTDAPKPRPVLTATPRW